jgi:hypothetical protein
VHEHILAVVTADEAVSLGGVEPLDGTNETIFGHLSFSLHEILRLPRQFSVEPGAMRA